MFPLVLQQKPTQVKKFSFIFLVLLLGIITFVIGINLFGKFIYNKQSCHSYNIDNIELRTGVNIPAVELIECSCIDNKKLAIFKIDARKVDFDVYIIKNKLDLKDGLYIKTGNNKYSEYRVILDQEQAELHIELTYKNEIEYF